MISKAKMSMQFGGQVGVWIKSVNIQEMLSGKQYKVFNDNR